MTAVRGLGVQRCVISRGGVARSSPLVPSASIAALVINEGIQQCDVRYYLALVVRGRPTLQLLFEESCPRLPLLALAHAELTAALAQGGGGGGCNPGCGDGEARVAQLIPPSRSMPTMSVVAAASEDSS